ncbi:RNA dependent RNA polymerase-domain-containing protein [Cytidiella melzeri]|nr:RNA dependent RNA polymerase-domain-containing protein [Cytidiella melzeri]
MPIIGTSSSARPSTLMGNLASPGLNRARSDDPPRTRTATNSSRKNTKGVPTGPMLELSNDGYVIIAHDTAAQELMDNLKLSWGTQYELARGVTKGWWQWADVDAEKLRKLVSMDNNSKKMAPSYVIDVMLDRKPGYTRSALCNELHREQLALLEHDSRGLGLMGTWDDQPNWYGGKIQQVVRLVPQELTSGPQNNAPPPVFHLQLDAMEIGRSFRFARYLGSRRLLQLKVPQQWRTDWVGLKKLLMQKFVLCGRVFVAFAVKDRKLYFVEINENYEREDEPAEGDQYRMSLEELVEWYNPMRLNSQQKISKWTTRFDLALSTSVPILQFKPENICIIDDVCARHVGDNIPASKIFTDGCGFMNASALVAIGRQLGFTERPTAVQGRILGSKGVWTLHPEHMSLDEPPSIWIRKSQQKIHLVSPKEFSSRTLKQLHRAHLIFDLVAPARVWTPSRLSKDTIMNLEYNKVPKDLFVRLMEEGLQREVEALTKWDGPGAMPLLWNAINKASGVTMQRLQRTAMGMRRILGLTRDRREDSDDSDTEDETPVASQASADTAFVPSRTDTPPYSIAERILERLQAGFSPTQDRILYEDIKRVLEETIKRFILGFRIVIPASAEVFIIPDPTSLLKPGQVHFTSSDYLKDPLVEADARTILGEVLLFRNPTRVASDVQKVTAVYLPELAQYKDVLVVPVQGDESLPSMLAGGDVDGDTAVCIWDPEIVNAFKQPDMVREPHHLMSNFEPLSAVPTVATVLHRMDRADSKAQDTILREHLLTGLTENRTGIYSKFHGNAIYQFGYNHPATIRNAFMFTTILDSRKSGLVLKEEVYQEDKQWKKYGWDAPVCLGGPDNEQIVRPRRQNPDGPFILEELLKEGNRIKKALTEKYRQMGKGVPEQQSSDSDLKKPWSEALQTTVPDYRAELDEVRKHVEDCFGDWSQAVCPPSSAKYEDKYQREERRKSETKKKLALAKRFVEGPEGCPMLREFKHLESVRASCAYTRSAKFAWAVAFQALCAIKASKNVPKAFTAEFAEVMNVPAAAVRVLSQDALLLE